MGRLRPRLIAIIATLAMLTASVGTSAAAPAVPSAHFGVGAIATLITGDRVVLGTSPSGVPTAEVVRAAGDGPASQLKLITLHGDVYAIPASAMAYLGRYLDPSLFDVTAIAAAGFGERIPLRLTFTAKLPKLPGVTITSVTGGSARGYVTTDSAKKFGAALATQATTDSLAGWPSSDDLFGSITSIAPILPSSPTVTPQFPQTTVVIKGVSRDGAPMRFAFGALFNMDDGRRFAGFVILFHGEARVSVPFGNYAAIFDDVNFARDGSVSIREMTAADFAVTGTQPPLIVDARSATVVPSLTTPKASVPIELDTNVNFEDEPGSSSFGWGWLIGLPGATFRISPMPAPSVGKVRMDTRWISIDPSSASGRYDFDASLSARRIPKDQSESLPSVSHALTVDNTYYADSNFQIGGAARLVFTPGSFFAFATFAPIALPLSRVDYVYAPAGSELEDLALSDQSAWDPGFVDGPFRPWQAGVSIDERWFRNPYTLAVPHEDPASRHVFCYACMTDTKMLYAVALNDADPRHFVEVFGGPTNKPVAWFTVYRNGLQLLRRPDRLGALFKVPTGAARYRIVNKLSRRWTFSPLSTDVTTVVTFHSADAKPAASNIDCYLGRSCSVLPVLTAALDLHASIRGTIPLGERGFDLHVGHVAGATQSAIRRVAVDVRRSGTHDWEPLSVTASTNGGYRVAFHAVPRMENHFMDVRVSVTDARGGTLVQTTAKAFLVVP
jgi:hypothetical protein